MSDPREILQSLLEDFRKALGKLKEVIELKKTEIVRDAAIQRFEFTYEVAWKSLKAYLHTLGVFTRSPNATFQEAYKLGIIENEQPFLQMMEMRNVSSHEYGEDAAEDIYSNLLEFYLSMEQVYQKISTSPPVR